MAFQITASCIILLLCFEAEVKTLDLQVNDDINNLINTVMLMNNTISTLKQELATIKAKQVNPIAFFASLTAGTQLGDKQMVIFDHVITNIGNAYHYGQFTAPVRGVYLMSITVMSTGGDVHVQMVKNGAEITRSYGSSTEADSGTVVALVELEIGDVVWVRHYEGVGTQHIHGGWSTFSGTLINAI